MDHDDLMVLRVHHLGLLVEDLETALPVYTNLLGFRAVERLDAPDHDINAVLLEQGETRVELFAPHSPDGQLQDVLRKRGQGLHHIAYEVADIDASLAAAKRAGLRLIDEAPRRGLDQSWRIAFLHPHSCGGVLTELVETNAPWHGVGQ